MRSLACLQHNANLVLHCFGCPQTTHSGCIARHSMVGRVMVPTTHGNLRAAECAVTSNRTSRISRNACSRRHGRTKRKVPCSPQHNCCCHVSAALFDTCMMLTWRHIFRWIRQYFVAGEELMPSLLDVKDMRLTRCVPLAWCASTFEQHAA